MGRTASAARHCASAAVFSSKQIINAEWMSLRFLDLMLTTLCDWDADFIEWYYHTESFRRTLHATREHHRWFIWKEEDIGSWNPNTSKIRTKNPWKTSTGQPTIIFATQMFSKKILTYFFLNIILTIKISIFKIKRFFKILLSMYRVLLQKNIQNVN